MTAPETASFREFADMVPCKPSYVTQLRRNGRLVLTDDQKRVIVKASLQRIEDTSDPSKRAVAARHAAARKSVESDLQETDDAPTEAAGGSEYQKSRAEREKWAAKQAQLEYERSIGKLLSAADVESAAATAIVVLRTSLESISTTLAPQLAATSDEVRVRAILDEEVEHILGECARQFAQLAKSEAASE